jgi:glutamine cyclotransferase
MSMSSSRILMLVAAVLLLGALAAVTTRSTAPAATPFAGSSAKEAAGATPAPVTGYEIVAEYPHDPAAYTQGLFWHDGYLYEGTGRNGSSWLRKIDPRTGEVLQQADLPDRYFGEGIARHGDSIYQLTWLAKRGFIYDADTFEPAGEFRYDTEGWGLTADDTHLILSDGSATLYFYDPDGFLLARTVRVTQDGDRVDDLNELEYIDGVVYANVWHSDFIYRIDPSTGNVIDRIDFSDLLAGGRPRDAEGVLNGIAFDPTTGNLFLTGKLWSKMFEIRLITADRPQP